MMCTKKKNQSCSQFGKSSQHIAFSIQNWQRTNGQSPGIDFSEGRLQFCFVKCSIKQNFPPKVFGSGELEKEAELKDLLFFSSESTCSALESEAVLIDQCTVPQWKSFEEIKSVSK